MDPNYAPVLLDLGTAYLRKGDHRNALASFERAIASGGENSVALSDLAQAHALSGNRAEALKILRKLESSAAKTFVSSWDLSFIYAALGEKKKALELLKTAVNGHVGWVVRLGIDPAFESLRSDPQFQELVHRVGIPSLPQ
jgi:tetratricopeptide (TPR) repeat protein